MCFQLQSGGKVGTRKWYQPPIPKVQYSEGPLFRKSTVRHSAKVWVKVRVKVNLRVSGNSKFSE